MSESSSPQVQVASIVTKIVLFGTCVFGVLGISIAIVAMAQGEFNNAKDILQTLFATILPLFGTWIGTVLAYYFSKENLLAANQTVQHLVNTITSGSKLAAVKANEVMIPIEKLIYIPYPAGTNDSSIDLKKDFLDFIKKNNISRAILLDDQKIAKYVLHKSTIESFIAEQYLNAQVIASPPNLVPLPALTFADMKSKGNSTVQDVLQNGVKFIREDANLSDAKTLIGNYKSCNDVFLTKSGASTDPVLGWITDKTIAEASIV